MEALTAAGYLVGAFLVGSIPFSYLMARAVSGVDLRRVGTGTVSGTGVEVTSGFWPMAVAGVLDIGKGAAASGESSRPVWKCGQVFKSLRVFPIGACKRGLGDRLGGGLALS